MECGCTGRIAKLEAELKQVAKERTDWHRRYLALYQGSELESIHLQRDALIDAGRDELLEAIQAHKDSFFGKEEDIVPEDEALWKALQQEGET